MKALLYNRYINRKGFLLAFVLTSSLYISTVLYPSVTSNPWNFRIWFAFLLFGKQCSLERVLPVSRDMFIKAGIFESAVVVGLSSVIGVVFNMIGNPPVQLLSVIAVWFSLFGIYSLLLTLPPANLVSSGYRTLLILIEFLIITLFLVFLHHFLVIDSYKVFGLQCLGMLSVWAVLMVIHTICYEKWGHEIRFL